MKRLRWTVATYLALVLLAAWMTAPELFGVGGIPVAEVVGGDPYWLLCMGCVAGAVGILLGGWVTITMALFHSGGALAVIGCAAGCRQALL